jgi:2-polyprenyl-6-methoxyphenol hydroxylase-like FAD-dependent oxidoreductase
MTRVVDIPPSVRRVRANRSKLRTLLIQGLDIEYEKRFTHYELTADGVRAHFTDGTSFEGSMLTGCDGNNSLVRKQMLGPEKSANQSVGVAAFGGTRHLSLEMTRKLRAIDPLLFQTMYPPTGDYGARPSPL